MSNFCLFNSNEVNVNYFYLFVGNIFNIYLKNLVLNLFDDCIAAC